MWRIESSASLHKLVHHNVISRALVESCPSSIGDSTVLRCIAHLVLCDGDEKRERRCSMCRHRGPSLFSAQSGGYFDNSRRCRRKHTSIADIGNQCQCWYLRHQQREGFGLKGSKEDQIDVGGAALIDTNGTASEPRAASDGTYATSNPKYAAGDESHNATSNSASTTEATTHIKWEANDFESDYQLLERAMARQSAISDLQQQQRKYTLDYGFARNRRPLIRDAMQCAAKIGLTLLLTTDGTLDGPTRSFRQLWQLWRCKASRAIHTITTIHHWVVGMMLPLLLLTLVKGDKLGPPGRPLDEYFTERGQPEAPKFFYTTEMSKKNARARDTGNFVLCLLENWSSAIVLQFTLGLCSMLALLGRLRIASCVGSSASKMQACTRLLTRLGAAAALHQYPSLLFELRRGDQPRPLCQSTAYMQSAVQMLFCWLPLGVASDLARIVRPGNGCFGVAGVGTLMASLLSVVAPVCHLVALGRILCVSKCSAVSLSEATSFPGIDNQQPAGDAAVNERKEVKWRYQLRWRTPQRIAKTIQSWTNYFFTGHGSLLFEMDDRKKQPIRFDEFSTEGAYCREHLERNGKRDAEDLIPHADQIAESLSLIFRDRDAAVRNATQSRWIKHQESYDTKALDDVLGVAVLRTFGVGISYDFDHFDSPAEGEEVSIHQLRARMAKSAVRRKRELDGAMQKELTVLQRLRDNVVTTANKELAEREMALTELGIKERHDNEVDRMRNALLTLIPTNADDLPKGTARYDNPMMVSEYVNLTAPFQQGGELKATVGDAPDPLAALENFVRRDFGDDAADAYRQDELAARKKEQDLLSSFRQRYGELEDDEVPQPDSQ